MPRSAVAKGEAAVAGRWRGRGPGRELGSAGPGALWAGRGPGRAGARAAACFTICAPLPLGGLP